MVEEAVARGIDRVSLWGASTGAVSDEAERLCRDHGIDVVNGACPLMYEEPVRGIHRLHRILARR